MLTTDERAREQSTSTGTGDFTTTGAVAKFVALTANVPVGSIVEYVIEHQTANEWETGWGIMSTTTNLKRHIVTRSSNANAAVNFSAGTKDVRLTALSQRDVHSFGENPKLILEAAGTAALNSFGITGSNAGTLTSRPIANTRSFTRKKRTGLVSAGGAGSIILQGLAADTNYFGDNTSLGGFILKLTFGCSDAATVDGARQLCGMRTGSFSNVEPSTITNHVGVGHGAANTNLFMYYGGSAAQSPVDLGVNFPANTLSVDMYQLVLMQPTKDNTKILYQVTRINTGHIAGGVLTGASGTALPASTTLIVPQSGRTNNATALAVALDFVSVICVDLSTG